MQAALVAVVAGLLGILGTALGGLLAARNGRASTERQEFRSAIIEFCTAIMIYRGAELDRMDARLAANGNLQELTDRVYTTRTTARNALYGVELSTTSRPVKQAVNRIFNLTKSIKDSSSKSELQGRRDKIEEEIGDLIERAMSILGVSIE
jgi:hypothetical protein